MLTNGLRKLCSVLLGTVLGVTTPPSFTQQRVPLARTQGERRR